MSQPQKNPQLREDLEDRLADLALQELLGNKRPPDLSQPVVAKSRPPRAKWRAIAKLTLAASVFIAGGIGIFTWWRSDALDQPTALVDTKFSRFAETLDRKSDTAFTGVGERADAPAHATGTVAGEGAKPASPQDGLGMRHYFAPSRRTPSSLYEVSGGAKNSNEPPDVMLLVTPRIIVQEEAENSLGIDRRRPDEGLGPGQAGDRYSRIVENPFLKAADNPLSTFSIDVDTASYAKARRYLTQNHMLPPPDAVRIEEFINYFHYDYPAPKEDDGKPFAAHVEVATCPWQPTHRLVRIGLKGREIQREARPVSNLVFLLDVSGSMEPDDRLPRVRRSMRMLVEQLGENDRVAMVVYAGASGMVLPSTPAYRKDEILKALDNLHAGGSTNGGAGIRLAYDTAAAHFIKNGTNRVILCTDGDFNVGTTSTAELERLAEEKAKTGVFLTVLGFGMGNHNDDMLEKLADKGNGNYGYIDTEEEARKLLVEELSGTLVTIAKDVKIQIEFNPQAVGAYRLLGYENRMLRSEDFNDDKKDAGEIGAGHTVTALYEIVPAGEKLDTPAVDPLRYQRPTQPTDATTSGELLTLKLRYKEPDGQESKAPLIFPVTDRGQQFGQASKDFRFAAAVAGFAMLLRDSQHRGNFTYDAVLEIAQEGRGEDRHGYRAAFLELVKQTQAIAGK